MHYKFGTLPFKTIHSFHPPVFNVHSQLYALVPRCVQVIGAASLFTPRSTTCAAYCDVELSTNRPHVPDWLRSHAFRMRLGIPCLMKQYRAIEWHIQLQSLHCQNMYPDHAVNEIGFYF